MASVSELETANFQGGRGMPWTVWPQGFSLETELGVVWCGEVPGHCRLPIVNIPST